MSEPAPTEFLLYQTEDGQSRIEVRMSGETVWLNLMQLSDLFGRDKSVISRHIKNLFDEGELRSEAVVANYATTATDSKTYQVAIHVEPDGRVLVDAPENASDLQIRTAVVARTRWIHGHVTTIRGRLAQVLPREYVSGESVLYLGRRYCLKVVVAADGTQQVRIRGSYVEVIVGTRSPALVRAALTDWYRSRAKAVVSAQLEKLAATLRWVRTPPPVRFQAMKVQWGSCSPAGRLTLNPHLVKAPRECIEYVLLHELCHLKEHNHSRRFYRMLDMHMPRWQQRKSRLDNLDR